jgi:hypothetical protein
VEELLLRLDESAARLSFDLRDQAHRGRNAEVGLEEDLLQILQRALDGSAARYCRDVRERDVLYFGPQRTGGYVARAPEYPACHLGAV